MRSLASGTTNATARTSGHSHAIRAQERPIVREALASERQDGGPREDKQRPPRASHGAETAEAILREVRKHGVSNSASPLPRNRRENSGAPSPLHGNASRRGGG